MASHGTLPLYYKNSKPTGLPGPAKSWKDNYLLVVVLVAFLILIAGTFWFLPPLGDKDADYERTYGRFTGNPASYITDVVIPSEPTLVPPEATGNRETAGGQGEKELDGNGGRGGEPGIKEVIDPIQVGDVEKGDRQVKEFDKHPPSTEHSETTTSEPPSSPESSRPPEQEGGVGEGGNVVAAEEGGEEMAADPVLDPVAEERRKKVVEV